MSRLDSFIARMTAQRAVLNEVCALLNEKSEALPGPVLELGLGSGRTYHHLRERLDGRRIIVFDRAVRAHPSCVPPQGDVVLGEIKDTGAAFAAQHGAAAALVHADLGNGTPAYDAELRSWLPGLAYALVRPGGWILSSTELVHANLALEPLPAEVPLGRYFNYRRV